MEVSGNEFVKEKNISEMSYNNLYESVPKFFDEIKITDKSTERNYIKKYFSLSTLIGLKYREEGFHQDIMRISE